MPVYKEGDYSEFSESKVTLFFRLGDSMEIFPILDSYTGMPLPNCSRPINYGHKASTLIQEFDSGHQQRRMKAAPKATFEFQYNILSKTEYQTIRDFYLKVLNVYPFYWTDPIEKIEYSVTFNQDTFVGIQKGHGPKGPWYEVQLKLIQCWDKPL